ncbi:MAG: YezD family protein [Candidatus Omnitrophica bacterium]|nr:YezD family protein [Candidatus Omnitrophota bacterium]MDD5238769.1 YezD family protein [Candidatus Omnitrophota bacterium]
MNDKNIINDAIINDISKTVHRLKYGVITIILHNSKIVQVEVAEKNRFDDVWLIEEGGGI